MPDQLTLIDREDDEPGVFSYYNTTHLQGNDLEKAQVRAGTQAREILDFFEAHRGQPLTPTEVQNALNMQVLTSVRRAITNLTDKGFLRKTNIKRAGKYGADNYCWVMDK